ncbi:MAG: trypsin-like peptidase domain-containing protein [Deltaproteobacteria bacterium]|nr:trypsin-like peptidase domain-containing protein [Deltaproteobacteria bacterium]
MRTDYSKCIAAFGTTLLLSCPGALAAPQNVNVPPGNIWIELARKAVPSVVNISTITTGSGAAVGTSDDMLRKFFDQFFGGKRGRSYREEKDQRDLTAPPGNEMMPKAVALGSGFIIDKSGTILTNNHVVADADEIKVAFTELPDDSPVEAKVIGRDPDLDIALLQVKDNIKRKFIPLPLGDSDQVEIGEYVLAVGNPFGQGHSVTHGIISQKGRNAPDFPLATYLQTDAPINPGNSGGPLVNLNGEVIAINNAIEARAQGIGFAIPINVVKQVLPQLKAKGKVARGYIGVVVGELTPPVAEKLRVPQDLHSPFVTQVYPEGPAARAGVRNYDVILDFDGKALHNGNDLIANVTAAHSGHAVPMRILRGGTEKIVTINVGRRPVSEETPKGHRQPSSVHRHHDEGAKVDTGMTLQTMTPELAEELGIGEPMAGVVVDTTDAAGPADKIGLSTGDIIMEVDQKPVADVKSFYSIVRDKKRYLLRVRKLTGEREDTFAVVVLDLK